MSSSKQTSFDSPSQWQKALEVVLKYYQARKNRLKHNIYKRQMVALRMVPFLLHFHQENLPGFQNSRFAISGIEDLPADKVVQAEWSRFFPQVPWPEEPADKSYEIDVIGMSGQAGSFAQSERSLFLYWVFLKEKVNNSGRLTLQRKADAICQWLRREFSLQAKIHVLSPEMYRNPQGFAQAFESKLPLPVQYDLFLSHFFSLNKKALLYHLTPFCEHKEKSLEVLSEWRRALQNESQLVDIATPLSLEHQDYIQASFDLLQTLRQMPYENAFELGLPFSSLLNGNQIPLREHVKKSLFTAPLDADPFEEKAKLLFPIFTNQADVLSTLYIRELYYLKLQPELSRSSSGSGKLSSQAFARIKDYVNDWGWSQMVLMTLDNAGLWNHKQLLSFHEALTACINFFCQQSKVILQNHDKTLKASEGERYLKTIQALEHYFQKAPQKILPIKVFSKNLTGVLKLLMTRSGQEQPLTWDITLETSSPSERSMTKTELKFMEKQMFLPAFLWLCQARVIGPGTRVILEEKTGEFPQDWFKELLASCTKLLSASRDTGMLDITNKNPEASKIQALLLGVNLENPSAYLETNRRATQSLGKSQGIHKSTKNIAAKNKITSKALNNQDQILDYQGLGNSPLQSLSLVYTTKTKELFCKTLPFAHNTLGPIIALMLSNALPQEGDIEFEILVPPSDEGIEIHSVLHSNLMRMLRLFSNSPEKMRRLVTRLCGNYGIFQALPNQSEVSFIPCSNIAELFQKLESVPDPSILHIEKHLTELERLRILLAAAQENALNLFFYREKDPHEFYLIDEKGALFFNPFPLAQARGFVGETIEFLKRYAEKRALKLHTFEIENLKDKTKSYKAKDVQYPDAVLSQRISPFVIALKEAEENHDNSTVSLQAGGNTIVTRLDQNLFSKLQQAATQAGGVSLLDLPERFSVEGKQEFNLQHAASAMRAAKNIKGFIQG